MSVLVIAEHDHQSIKPATLHAVSAAQQLNQNVHVLVAGFNCEAAAQHAARIQGVNQVFLADSQSLAHQLAENISAQVLQLARQYTHVLAASTAFSKNVLPRVAAQLDVAQLSDVIHILTQDTFQRPIYAGNVIATVQSLDRIKVLTVRSTHFPIASVVTSSSSPILPVQAVGDFGKSQFVSCKLAVSDKPDLTSARVVVSGGRGVGSAENFELLNRLASKLNAAVGASRAAVDAGFAPNDWQIGQTGKVVAPDLYFAFGISGAIQHLAGMSNSKVIVAVNKDPEAPIFAVADYGLVADLFEVIPELESKL